jgi:hypothetical protein
LTGFWRAIVLYSQKSPGGSWFPYYYKGGEIHCLKYGGFLMNQEALFTLMKAEADFIIKINRPLRIWVDFYGTSRTDQILAKFLENIGHLSNSMIKLAIVGFSFPDKIRFRRFIKKLGIELSVPVKFFSDPEDAKAWLVWDFELKIPRRMGDF